MCMNLEGHDITLGSSLEVSGAMKPSHNAAGSLLAFRKIGQARGREGWRERRGKHRGSEGREKVPHATAAWCHWLVRTERKESPRLGRGGREAAVAAWCLVGAGKHLGCKRVRGGCASCVVAACTI